METMSFQLHSSVRGFHVYQAVWAPVLGEVLNCTREMHNRSDRFAVAVQKGETVVGHIPRDYSCISSLFLQRGGSITSTVNGHRRYSHDLEQGGLEIPCEYTFTCKEKDREYIDKTKRRLEELQAVTTEIIANTSNSNKEVQPLAHHNTGGESNNGTTINLMQALEAFGPEMESDAVWVTIRDIKLTEADKRMILGGEKLMDQHINSAQRLLRAQFPKLNGLVLSLLQHQPLLGATDNAIQIFHVRGNHWIVATTAPNSKVVYVYDSAYSSLDQSSSKIITSFFRCSPCNVKIVDVQKQAGCNECGLFAIANATTFAFGHSPVKARYDQLRMRDHLVACLMQQKMEVFPS